MAKRNSSGGSKRSTCRVAKKTRSKTVATSSSARDNVLERMVEEAIANEQSLEPGLVPSGDIMDESCDSDGRLRSTGGLLGAYEGKGKGKLTAMDVDNGVELAQEQVFRLFDLPTEIRLEIYRACLTRPYNILLSRDQKVVVDEDEEQSGEYNLGTSMRSASSGSASATTRPVTRSTRNGTRSRSTVRPTLRASSSSAQSQSSTSRGLQLGVGVALTAGTLRRAATDPKKAPESAETQDGRPKMEDPLLVTILRTNKDVYKEARDVLYSENVFELDIATAVHSLAALHQRSRRRIKHVELTIPTYTEILESFSETVRLSLRYCSGLRRLVINTPFALPGSDGSSGGNTTVYANGFDILRWLPQGCEVVLTGTKNKAIDTVVGRHMRLAELQDKIKWHQRQYIQPINYTVNLLAELDQA